MGASFTAINVSCGGKLVSLSPMCSSWGCTVFIQNHKDCVCMFVCLCACVCVCVGGGGGGGGGWGLVVRGKETAMSIIVGVSVLAMDSPRSALDT